MASTAADQSRSAPPAGAAMVSVTIFPRRPPTPFIGVGVVVFLFVTLVRVRVAPRIACRRPAACTSASRLRASASSSAISLALVLDVVEHEGQARRVPQAERMPHPRPQHALRAFQGGRGCRLLGLGRPARCNTTVASRRSPVIRASVYSSLTMPSRGSLISSHQGSHQLLHALRVPTRLGRVRHKAHLRQPCSHRPPEGVVRLPAHGVKPTHVWAGGAERPVRSACG